MTAKPEKMPRGLEVQRCDEQLHLKYRHHRGAGLFIFLAGIFWASMLFPAGKVLAAGGVFGGRELIAFSPFVLLTVGFCYVGLAKLINVTEIRLSAAKTTVRHSPIPWLGSLDLSTPLIESFEIKKDLQPVDARHRVTLALVANLHDKAQKPLLRAIDDSKAALRIHQEADSFLKELRFSSAAESVSLLPREGSSPAWPKNDAR